MEPEFDRYAKEYEALLRDPVRDRFAQSSDFFHWRKWVLINDVLQRLKFSVARSRWLDVGCGKGELLTLGSRFFASAAGCDPSKEMSRSSGVDTYHQPSPRALPFADNSFDFVTAVCVYHHVEESDRIPLTREVYRVLRPGGILSIIDHNPINPITQLIVRRTPIDYDAHLLTLGQAERYVSRGGFRSLCGIYFLYLPEKWYKRIPLLERSLSLVPLGGQYALFAQKTHVNQPHTCKNE